MSSPELRLVAGPEHAGRRLDAVVGDLEAVGSRAEAQRLISAGRALVDGQPRPKRYLVAEGEALVVRPVPPPPSDLEPEHVAFGVPWEDEYLMVIDKPAGIVVHPSPGHPSGTLVHGLLEHDVRGGADPTRPGIVHRLDRDTSGLMVVARSERVHRRLSRLLRNHDIDRRYLTLVHGDPPPALTVDRPVGRDRRVRTRMSTATERGRPAVTHLRRLERVGHYALLEARLETGRTHQIRVHLEAAGYPVAGDPVYGRRTGDLGLERQFLHSARLAFTHPETGEPINVESPLPADLQGALDRARALAPPRPR